MKPKFELLSVLIVFGIFFGLGTLIFNPWVKNFVYNPAIESQILTASPVSNTILSVNKRHNLGGGAEPDFFVVGVSNYGSGITNSGKIYAYRADLSLSQIWEATETDQDRSLGGIVRIIGDLNGDGVSDVLAGSSLSPQLAAPVPDQQKFDYQKGKSFVYSGTNGQKLDALDGEFFRHQFGEYLGSAGDINGDGVSDFVVSTPYYPDFETAKYQGAVWAFGGGAVSSRKPIWKKAGVGPVPHSNAYTIDLSNDGFGGPVTEIGDVNGDGIGEIAVGTAIPEGIADYPVTGVTVLNGSNGGILWNVQLRDITSETFGGFLGYDISSVGDVNNDGIPDLLASAGFGPFPVSSYLVVLNGANGSVLWTKEIGVQTGWGNGRIKSIKSLNGDNVSDIIAIRFLNASNTNYVMEAFSGANGSLLWSKVLNSNIGVRKAVSTVKDLNSDNKQEILAGALDTNDGKYKVYIFSGTNGNLINTITPCAGCNINRISVSGGLSH